MHPPPYGPPPIRQRTGIPGPAVAVLCVLLSVIFGVGGCVVGFAAGSGSEEPAAARATETSSRPKTGRSTPAAKPPTQAGLGEPATANGVQLTGLKVTDPGGSARRLVTVQVRVKNVGDEPLGINPMNFKLIGSDDQEYSLELGGAAGRQMDVSELSPGVARTGWVAFRVPARVSASRIVFTEALGEEIVSAGLTE